jgi:hypothetical protein
MYRRRVHEEIRGLGHKDVLVTLSTIQNDENNDVGFRVAAASALAPYVHPKYQATPTPRFIELQIDIPEFTHVSDAENFLAKIALLVARGHLDIQSGQELSGLVKTWIDSQYQKDELAYKISPPDQRDTTITITGGLPQLPGCENLIMPVINGSAVQEQLLSAPKDVVPPDPPPNEFTPGELPDTPPSCLKAQGLHPLQKHHFAPALGSSCEPATGTNSTTGQGPDGRLAATEERRDSVPETSAQEPLT